MRFAHGQGTREEDAEDPGDCPLRHAAFRPEAWPHRADLVAHDVPVPEDASGRALWQGPIRGLAVVHVGAGCRQSGFVTEARVCRRQDPRADRAAMRWGRGNPGARCTGAGRPSPRCRPSPSCGGVDLLGAQHSGDIVVETRSTARSSSSPESRSATPRRSSTMPRAPMRRSASTVSANSPSSASPVARAARSCS